MPPLKRQELQRHIAKGMVTAATSALGLLYSG